MGSRNFWEVAADEPEVKFLHGTVTFGSSGAVSSYTGDEVSTVAKTATGKYTITLKQWYPDFLFVSGIIERSGSAPTATIQLASEAVSTAGTVVVWHLTDAGTPAAADPTSGDILHFVITVKNTSA